MSNEWIWAALIIAAPLLVFLSIEAAIALRRRREIAIARRPKGPRPRRPGVE